MKKQKATNEFFSFDFYDDCGAEFESASIVEITAIPIADDINTEASEQILEESDEEANEEANEEDNNETQNDIHE
mgnify:CR=1 FL=1